MTKQTRVEAGHYAEEVAAVRPATGWAGVKFVITERALYHPQTKNIEAEPYSRFVPPGWNEANVGDVFSLSEDEAERYNVEAWLRSGVVEVYRERRPKAEAKADAPVTEAADGS